jgi:gamma-D-glutamyl-L-lysine dipeptidyl-peptidase
MSLRLVGVPVAPVWRSSTGTGRDDRVTEALVGEPVAVDGDARDGRMAVTLPWQPSSLDDRGYPGWIDVEHLGEEIAAPPALHVPTGALSQGSQDPLELARTLLGTPYVWGGLSADGIDCSGLVHLVHRALGRVVPRDARDQAAALPAVPVDEAASGDLYFFARAGKPIHHVGLVAGSGSLLHASDRDGGVVEMALPSSGRQSELTTAARVVPALP